MDPETTPAPQRELAEPAPTSAALPPHVELNGADALRALGLADELDQREKQHNPATVDWGDEEPDEVWLDLYERGLVRPPYRGPRAVRALAEKMADWEPLGTDITDDDILRWLGRR